MTIDSTHLAFLALGLALGGAIAVWLKTRPITTKAEALRLLAAQANIVAKMPGAAEDKAQAEQEMSAEALAAQIAAAALAKINAAPAA
jgi:hypothetical protein